MSPSTAAVLIILGLILAIWCLLIVIMEIADHAARRKLETTNELAEWRRKVDAMRRLHDEDGAA